ncbi:MAG: ABC transporter ATP-binding protein [Candidatus Omnitrophica bacterium]|nr:ABC transporter ATP-binding protein [Candidatus Omnitrophota bacterium]
MSKVILKFQNAGKCFRIYQTHKTLFQLSRAVISGTPIKTDFWALKNLNLNIRLGEKIGIIGLNGSGKTTFFRLASGILTPNEGTVTGNRKQRLLPMFAYGAGLQNDQSVYENIFIAGAFLGLLEKDLRAKLDSIMEFNELAPFLHMPLRHLSTGQRLRLAFSVFVHNQESFMAFDEGLSFGDYPFQHKTNLYFKRIMSDPEKTIMIASHNLAAIRAFCTKVVWLHQGTIRHIGPPNQTIHRYRTFCSQLDPAAGPSVPPEDKNSLSL